MNFQPTPLEEAYGLYLLETVFQVIDIHNNFKISGRVAANFLRQSNLPRDVLRHIWSTVDPESIGSLTHPNQFYAILKLVALGQMGLLSGDNFTDALSQSTATLFPRFEGMYQQPNEDFLRNYYQHKTGKPFPVDSANVAPESTSIEDAFGGLLSDITDAPLPTLPSFESVPSTMDSMTHNVTTTLGEQGKTVTTMEQNNIQSEVDQTTPVSEQLQTTNRMDSSTIQSGNWDMLNDLTQGIGAATVQDGTFGDFEGVAKENSLGVDVEEDTTFGDFEGIDGLDAVVETTAQDGIATEHHALGQVVNSAVDVGNPIRQDDGATFNGFGDIDGQQNDGNRPTLDGMNPSVEAPTMSEWGAFDALAAVEDAPLASLQEITRTASTESAETAIPLEAQAHSGQLPHPGQQAQPDALDSDFDFGDFQDPVSADQPEPSVPAPAAAVNEWGAFDALAAVQDAPLASLQEITRTASAESAELAPGQEAQAHSEERGQPGDPGSETDFGDFQDPVKVPSPAATVNNWGAFDALAAVEDVPLASLQEITKTASADSTGSVHGRETQAHLGEPPHSELQAQPEDPDSETDFGDFQDPVIADQNGPSVPVPSAGTNEFGALDAVEDAPLASFEAMARTASVESVENGPRQEMQAHLEQQPLSTPQAQLEKPEFEMGFEDFRDPLDADQKSVPAPDAAAVNEWGAFDAIPAVGDAPLVSLHEAARTASAESQNTLEPKNSETQTHPERHTPRAREEPDSETDFGDFQDTASAVLQVPPSTASELLSADPSRAFDLLAPVADAPLPSLKEIIQTGPTDKEKEHIIEAGEISLEQHEEVLEPHTKDDMSTASKGIFQSFSTGDHNNAQPVVEDSQAELEPVDHWGEFTSTYSGDSVPVRSGAGIENIKHSEHEEPDKFEIPGHDEFGDFTDAPIDGEKHGDLHSSGTMATEVQSSEKAITMERLDSTYYSTQEPASEHSTGSDDFSGFVDAQSTVPTSGESQPVKSDHFGGIKEATQAADAGIGGFDAFGTTDVKKHEKLEDMDNFDAFESVPSSVPERPDCTASSEGQQHHRENRATRHVVSFGSSELTNDANVCIDDKSKSFNSDKDAECKIDQPRGNNLKEYDDFQPFSSPLGPMDGKISTQEKMVDGTENFASFGDVDVSKEETQIDSKDENFEDFGDFASGFDDVDADKLEQEPGIKDNSVEYEKMVDKEAFVQMAAKLPSAIRRRIDGSMVDFGTVYDHNNGISNSSGDEMKSSFSRCLEIIALLAGPQKALASHLWRKSLQTIHSELSKGIDLTKKATSFSETDRSTIADKLLAYVRGLGGFVLLARCIASVLGDLLLVDESAGLTDDNLISQWSDLALAKQIVDIELQWKRISKHAEDLFSNSKLPSIIAVPTIEELRRRSKAHMNPEQRCNFTLLPLSAAPLTVSMATVVWKKKEFFACSANFLANRCSFYDTP